MRVTWHSRLFSKNPDRVLASQWIRVFQLIEPLKALGVVPRINSGYLRSDVVVFSRAHRPFDLFIAKLLRRMGTKVVLDLVVNYFEPESEYQTGQMGRNDQENAKKMIRHADAVICSSGEIAKSARRYHANVSYVPDSLDLEHFKAPEPFETVKTQELTLSWSGDHSKLRDIAPLFPAIRKSKLGLLIITNKVDWAKSYLEGFGVHAEVLRWRHRTFPNSLRKSNIGIAYRELDAYNKSHSNFKILAPMSQGLPVLASPLPSYQEALKGGGGLILDSLSAWEEVLCDEGKLVNLIATESSNAVVASHRYNSNRIASLYYELFTEILHRKSISPRLA